MSSIRHRTECSFLRFLNCIPTARTAPAYFVKHRALKRLSRRDHYPNNSCRLVQPKAAPCSIGRGPKASSPESNAFVWTRTLLDLFQSFDKKGACKTAIKNEGYRVFKCAPSTLFSFRLRAKCKYREGLLQYCKCKSSRSFSTEIIGILKDRE